MRRWFHLAVLGLAVSPFACATGGDGLTPGDAATPMLEAGGAGDASTVDATAEAGHDAAVPPDVGAASDVGPSEADAADGSDAVTVADAADAGCPGDHIVCGSACVDPSTDPSHCGGCGTICSSGICGTVLSADMTVQPPNWTFNGVAVWDPAGPSARLTTAKTDLVAGTVVYNHPIVTDAFSASFQFRIGAGGGGSWDGMGFMIEANGPTALGSVGAGLGIDGLDGFGVELDVYDNGKCGDNSGNHVGIDLLKDCGGLPTSLFASPNLTGTVSLDDGQWHTAGVQLAAGAMSVTVDSHAVVSSVALTGFATGTSYYYGFGGGIGGGSGSLGAQAEVKAVAVSFPSPRCL